VDNGSQDGSIHKLQNDFADDPMIFFIFNKSNLGFSAGVNVGIRFAMAMGADFIFLINNDAIIDKECLSELLMAMNENPLVGIAGPRIFYHRNPQKISTGAGYFSYLKAGLLIPEKNKYVWKCNGANKYVTFLSGCAMLIKREVFEKIGLFDEDYFFYEEDLDFCLKTMRKGFVILYVPSAKVWHKIESIIKDRTNSFVMYHRARSRIIWLYKNFSTHYFLYGLLINFIVYMPYRICQIVLGLKSIGIAKAWFKGTWAGLVIIMKR